MVRIFLAAWRQTRMPSNEPAASPAKPSVCASKDFCLLVLVMTAYPDKSGIRRAVFRSAFPTLRSSASTLRSSSFPVLRRMDATEDGSLRRTSCSSFCSASIESDISFVRSLAFRSAVPPYLSTFEKVGRHTSAGAR